MFDSNFFEAMMLVAFGCAWPTSIYKTYCARKNHGKSVAFLYIVIFGYLCGIIHQLLEPQHGSYVLYFYMINIVLVSIDVVLYYRNARLQKLPAK